MTRTNRLIHATSPYLLQHATNPVDWYPWGTEALSKAKTEDKPILLSIGYSACHWCHVMERESFESEEIAALMNAYFVPVKVDREERPDLDDVYMAATLALNQGQGGWPMTVFLTPDQEPFYAGTYFPPEDAWGRPGFRTVLKRIADLWQSERANLRLQAADLADHLRQGARPAPGSSPGEAELRAALDQLAQDFDPRHGGFGGAPKFPPTMAMALLLRCHRRFGDDRALAMVRTTLAAMARGGLHDHVGGGFFRYATDERWLVPHFEKMLYDNALLARAYLEGFAATGDAAFARVAGQTLDYVLQEMTSPEGGFYSATDADSEGEEGKFFVWTPAQVREALGDGDSDEEAARHFCAFYDITDTGNWEGKSIPNTPEALADVAARLGLPVEELRTSLEGTRARLYEARHRRVPPAKDDKILTAWNGLMISALAEGSRVLGERRYLLAAERAARFLLARLRSEDGELLRTYRIGTAAVPAFLEDHAYLAEGLLDLYEAGAPEAFLREAEALADRMLDRFAAPGGGFFATTAEHEALILRPREGHDGATPSANATAAHVLARLSFHLDSRRFRDEAALALRAYGKGLARHGRAFAKSLLVVDLLLDGPVEIAFVGRAGGEDLDGLRREVGRHFLPNRIVAHHDPSSGRSSLPLLAGKDLVDGRAALYVCHGFVCRAPVTGPDDVHRALTEKPPTPAGSFLAPSRRTGHARPDATAAHASRWQARGCTEGFRPLGRTGLMVSRLGFGTYRVDDETPEHGAALERALLSGCNLIDTSTNYTDGGSERLVGEVLEALVASGKIQREDVVVVSKIGYIQGDNLKMAQARAAAGEPFPEVVECGKGLWHCLHPVFLADQLQRSLDRLGLATLDFCLLHNPEYFLADAVSQGYADLERLREEFYRRLEEAFHFFEGEVRAGRLLGYGVSSNTAVKPPADPEATSLTRMLAAARQAGGEAHHLRLLQLPMNLVEAGAALEENNGPDERQTVLEHAKAQGVGVLVNRPLNAFGREGLVRLADVSVPEAACDLEEQIAVVGRLEEEYLRDIASRLEAAEKGVPPDQFFRFAEALGTLRDRVKSLEHWREIEAQALLPRLTQALRTLDRSLGGDLGRTWRDWRARYVPEMRRALDELGRLAALGSAATSKAIGHALEPLFPEAQRHESLSRKALWIAASTPGVSAVLCGMRRVAYVEDALGILGWPRFSRALAAFPAVAKVELP